MPLLLLKNVLRIWLRPQKLKWPKNAIYGKTQTEICSKPPKFDVTLVGSCFGLGGGGYIQNSENNQNGNNDKKNGHIKKMNLIIKLWLILSIWLKFGHIWKEIALKHYFFNIDSWRSGVFPNWTKMIENVFFALIHHRFSYNGKNTHTKYTLNLFSVI